MAAWIATLSGEAEDPAHIRELLGELRTVASRERYGTGSSEFNSAHVAAQNFHEQARASGTPGEATGSPGDESWTPGQTGGTPTGPA